MLPATATSTYRHVYDMTRGVPRLLVRHNRTANTRLENTRSKGRTWRKRASYHQSMDGGAVEAVAGAIALIGMWLIPIGLLIAVFALERRSRVNGERLRRIESLLEEQVELARGATIRQDDFRT